MSSPRMKVGTGIFLTVLGLAVIGAAIWTYYKEILSGMACLLGVFGALITGRGVGLIAGDVPEEEKDE